MTGVIAKDTLEWGMQLPVQSQSGIFVQPWERDAGPLELARVAVTCDEAGAFYVGVCDHVAIPRPLDQTMGATWYDTVATLAWIAAQTRRVNLLSHVSVLNYRHPLVSAKAFSTLDVLSGGRAILGVGAGHVEAEFDRLGVDFVGRGATLDASLEVVREVFDTGESGDALVGPRSPRAQGPPIWVGGSSMPALRRAVRFGDGWLPQGRPKMGMRGAIEWLRTARRELHGDDDVFDIGINTEPIWIGEPDWEVGEHTLSGPPDAVAAGLRRYRGLDVGQLQLRFMARSAGEMCEQIKRFGAEVWPAVREQ